jgi:hypothetical protein
VLLLLLLLLLHAMLGGAGGAYTTLFAEWETCYGLLRDFLREHPAITSWGWI